MAKRNQYNKTVWSDASFLRAPNLTLKGTTTLRSTMQSSGSTLARLQLDTHTTAIAHGSTVEITHSSPGGIFHFTDVTLSATEEFTIFFKNVQLASSSAGGGAALYTQTTATGSVGGFGGAGVSLYTWHHKQAEHANIRVVASNGSLTNESVKVSYFIVGGSA